MNNGYAVVLDGKVINVIVWDGVTEYAPDEGELVPLTGNAGIGWGYVNGEFIKPEPPERTPEELIAEAASIKNGLMNLASKRIEPLQFAVDLDMATAEEAEQLLAWKKYMVLLNRVDPTQAPDITWPEQPQ